MTPEEHTQAIGDLREGLTAIATHVAEIKGTLNNGLKMMVAEHKVQLTTIEGEGRGPPYAYRVPTSPMPWTRIPPPRSARCAVVSDGCCMILRNTTMLPAMLHVRRGASAGARSDRRGCRGRGWLASVASRSVAR